MTAGQDKSIRLWNPHKGTLIKSYIKHSYEVLSVDMYVAHTPHTRAQLATDSRLVRRASNEHSTACTTTASLHRVAATDNPSYGTLRLARSYASSRATSEYVYCGARALSRSGSLARELTTASASAQRINTIKYNLDGSVVITGMACVHRAAMAIKLLRSRAIGGSQAPTTRASRSGIVARATPSRYRRCSRLAIACLRSSCRTRRSLPRRWMAAYERTTCALDSSGPSASDVCVKHSLGVVVFLTFVAARRARDVGGLVGRRQLHTGELPRLGPSVARQEHGRVVEPVPRSSKHAVPRRCGVLEHRRRGAVRQRRRQGLRLGPRQCTAYLALHCAATSLTY